MKEPMSRFIMAMLVVAIVMAAIFTIAANNEPTKPIADGASKPANIDLVDTQLSSDTSTGSNNTETNEQNAFVTDQWATCSLTFGYQKPC